MKGRSGTRMLSAAQVARFCDVDLKTIHNWADKGKISCWRTLGRHLRFRRLDVVDFLRAYGFSLPDSLRETRPTVTMIDEDSAVLASARRVLSGRFEITTFDHIVQGLIALAAEDPDVLVLGDNRILEVGVVAAHVAASPATRHVRVVTLGMQSPHAAASVPTQDLVKLRQTLEHLTGIE